MRLYISLLAFGLILLTPIYAAAQQNDAAYLQLQTIISKVYENNPTLLAAREELKQTQELYPQARAGWLPSVNGEASIFATDIENSNFGNGDGATTKDYTLSVDQAIWRGGRTFAETARAKDLIRAGMAVLNQAEQDILQDALTAYIDLIQDTDLLELRLQNEDILLRELQAAWERMDIGDITDTDVQQAKSRLSRARSSRIAAQSNLDISKAQFEEIVGMPAPEKLMIPYINIDLPHTIEDMLDLAARQNPELLIIQYEQRASEHNADATFRELLPQVSAFASMNRQYDPQPGIIDESNTETIGLRARISFYEGGATRSRIREARHIAKRQHYQIQETRRRIRQEVISNWRSYKAAKDQTENRKQEIEASEKALKGVREEARIGQRTVLDILDADEEVINAKADLARARRDEKISRYALANSLGLLNARNILQAVSNTPAP